MSRILLAIVLVCAGPAGAAAKDLCIQFTSGAENGSRIFLKRVNLGRGNVGPANGYYSRRDPNLLTYFEFFPVFGQSIVNERGDVVLGLAVSAIAIRATSRNVQESLLPLNIGCSAGTDGKLTVGELCGGKVFGSFSNSNANVIDCDLVDPIP